MLHQNSINVMTFLHCITLDDSELYIQQSLHKYCCLWQIVYASAACNSPSYLE